MTSDREREKPGLPKEADVVERSETESVRGSNPRGPAKSTSATN